MRIRAAFSAAAAMVVLASCAAGTGEPEWDLPLTWVRDAGTSVTLEADGRASVDEVPHGERACSAGASEARTVSGSGEWRWDGHGRMVVLVDGQQIAVYAASYRGALDWSRLLIDPCGTDYEDESPVELFLDAPLSALEGAPE